MNILLANINDKYDYMMKHTRGDQKVLGLT